MFKKLSIQEKLANPYKARTTAKAVKDVDLNERIATGLFNSYYYIDSDLDMLLPGCASKSIQERGVGSQSGNKIKHLKDHNWSQNIARIDVLDERTVDFDGKQIQGIYHESFYPEATDSTDMLIKIQEGMYDARSIGFQYEKLVFCERDSDNEDFAKNYEMYLPMAINPEVAEESGFFWAVKEIILWEGSDVSFGANQLTPLLGIKSGMSANMVMKELFGKLDICRSMFKVGKLSDEGFHTLDMEMKQIKSYIATLTDQQPSKKGTEKPLSRQHEDTAQSTKFIKSLINLQ